MATIITKEYVEELVKKQRSYFYTGATLSYKARIEALKKLKEALVKWEQPMIEALHSDLGRSEAEAYFCDIGSVKLELNETIHGLRKWMKTKRHASGLVCFPSLKTTIDRTPYGVTLIISPFNFPFLLSLGVLIASLAGGNTAIIKASSKSKACTEILAQMIKDTFDPCLVTVLGGGHDVADFCLETRVDKIFYTGSPNVSRHVLALASKHITPVALELGGETGNWCIVRRDADILDAARKIAFFKACNSGQICININQVAVDKQIASKFIEALKQEFTRQLGTDIIHNEEYAHLINKQAYDKCDQEVKEYQSRVVFGGVGDETSLRYSPTLIYPVLINEPLVNHELFNPILGIVEYEDEKIDDLLTIINSREHGLAFYLFTKNKKWAKQTMRQMQFGGGCINEVCVHLMVKGAPFNGTGHSGMGSYHGKYGYEEFTHPVTVLHGSNHFNLPLREHPYSKKKLNLIKKFEK